MAAAKKGALRKGQMPVFIDESGFYLLPSKVRTYAPVGQRPTLRVHYTRAHLSVMGGITPAGDLFTPAMDKIDMVRGALTETHRGLAAQTN